MEGDSRYSSVVQRINSFLKKQIFVQNDPCPVRKLKKMKKMKKAPAEGKRQGHKMWTLR